MLLLITRTMIGSVVFDRRREILTVHQETAVAGKAYDGAFGVELFCGNGCRQPVTHRARSRSSLRAKTAKAMEAVQPRGVIARAVGHDRILGQYAFEKGHDWSHRHFARSGLRRRRPGKIGSVGNFGFARPVDVRGWCEMFDSFGKRVRGRVDCEARTIDAS